MQFLPFRKLDQSFLTPLKNTQCFRKDGQNKNMQDKVTVMLYHDIRLCWYLRKWIWLNNSNKTWFLGREFQMHSF